MDALTGYPGHAEPFHLLELSNLCFVPVQLYQEQLKLAVSKGGCDFGQYLNLIQHPCLVVFHQAAPDPEVLLHPEGHGWLMDQAGVWLPWQQPEIRNQLELKKGLSLQQTKCFPLSPQSL